MDEGYIKFHQRWQKTRLPEETPWRKLGTLRDELHSRKLIGVYSNGIGYGNVSMRCPPNFLITGSATGSLLTLGPEHFALVKEFDMDQNWVSSIGLSPASSETLSHAAFYNADPDIQVVVHVHHRTLWRRLLHTVPTTPESAGYGTPQMALEIQRLFQSEQLRNQRIAVLGGHPEGIFTFGADPQMALSVLDGYLRQL